MRHKTNVGLINTHTEGNCRNHHHRRICHEMILILSSRLRIKARVIGDRIKVLVSKKARHLFGLLARQTINYA